MERMTRDCRELNAYISHFKKYDKEVAYKEGVSMNDFGIIEDVDGILYFHTLLYHGLPVRKNFCKKGKTKHVKPKENKNINPMDEFMKRDFQWR